MNITMISNQLRKYYNQNHTFIYYGSRGQNEKFEGKIIRIYPRCFLIETNNGILKSFSFSDFAIHSLKIIS